MTKLLGIFQDLKIGKQLSVCIYTTSRNIFDGVKIPKFYKRAEVNSIFCCYLHPSVKKEVKDVLERVRFKRFLG